MPARPALSPSDVGTALALLTRLPIQADFARSSQAAWAWPLAGVVTGALGGALAWGALALGLPAAAAAVMAIASAVIVTGAMHEDGLADSADGFWGGWEPQRRLEIMRDSRIGTYGVLALTLAVAMKWALLETLMARAEVFGPLIAAAVLGRATMGLVAAFLRHARRDGLSASTGRPHRMTAAIGAALAIVLAWGATGFVPTVIAACVVGATALASARIARAKIGGQTGDILGATAVLGEIAALMAYAALL